MSKNQLDRWNERLKKLPIFNMSLSSKELFHSNFIAWVIETYPVQMGRFFSEILNIDEEQSINKNTVQREKKSIDLAFELGDTLVLIENKVKSIAYKEQLDKYSQYMIKEFNPHKLNKIEYILLSLKEPTFFNENKYNKYYETKDKNDQLIKWIYISYEKLITYALKPLVDSDLVDNYHKFLIKDYIEFMQILNENIVKQINKTNIINLYKQDTNEYNMLKTLTNLRMHDFFEKGVFENFTNIIYNTFKIKYDDIKIYKNNRQLDEDKSLYISHGMTKSKGFVHFSYKYANNISFGVQVQGSQYRLFIEGSDEKNILKIATQLVQQEKNFFIFPSIFKDIGIRPVNDNGEFSKEKFEKKVSKDEQEQEGYHLKFNKFHTPLKNHLFLYKSITLNKLDIEIGDKELAEIICHNIYKKIKAYSIVMGK